MTREIVGWVHLQPVPVTALTAWLGPVADHDAPDARRLRRWAAHVVLMHELLHTRYRPREPAAPTLPDPQVLGSILAAVSAGCPCAMQLLHRRWLTPPLASAAAATDRAADTEYVLEIEREDGDRTGPVTVDHAALAGPLGEALRRAEVGQTVWLADRPAVRLVERRPVRATPPAGAAAPWGAVRSFCEWTDREFARAVVVAPGFEHPGDPRAPGFVHHH